MSTALFDEMTLVWAGEQAKYEPVKAQPKDNYLVHLSTWDMHGKSRITYNQVPLGHRVKALPDTYYLTEEVPSRVSTIPLDAPKQHWLLAINMMMYLGVVWTELDYYKWYNDGDPQQVEWGITEICRALTDDRSHTNRYGINNRNNYLRDPNADPKDGEPLFAKLITGHARLRKKNDQVSIRTVPPHGKSIAVECINAAGDYWQYNPIDHPWLFDMPLLTGRVIGRDRKGYPYIVRDDLHIPYGNFGNLLIFPMWLPGTDTAYVPLRYTRPMREDESIYKFQ